MSLKVWLPLNGDLHNQGYANIKVENLGATISSAGKIGKCYAFNGSSTNYLRLPPILTNTDEFSIAFWVKNTAINTNYCYYSQRVEASGTGYTIFYISGQGVRFDDGSSLQSSVAFAAGTWHHVVCCRDSEKKYIYIDGVLSISDNKTNTSANKVNSHYSLIGGSQSNSAGSAPQTNANLFNGGLNDYRIYNHCLSAAEVREISQGLILHYKLDDIYAEMTTNLYNGTFSNTCYNGATGKYSYGTNTDIYKTTGNFQGKDSVKIYMGTAGLSAYPYIYFDAFNTTGTAIHTLSFDYFPTSQTNIIPYSYNGTYNISYKTNNGAHDSKTNISSITIPVITNQWNHISITMQKYDTTNTSRGNGYIRIGSASHTSTTTDYWLFANIQVEAKDHETGYTLPGTTRSNIQIQDSSGYNHNGVCVNTTINNDSPRHDTCISCTGATVDSTSNTITGAQFFYCNIDMPAINAITIAWWGKNIAYGRGGIFETSNTIQTNTTKGTDYNTTAIANWDSTFGIYNGTTRINIFSNFNKDGNWHYHTITFDGANVKYYCDNTIKQTSALTGTLPAWKSFCMGLGKAGGVWRQIKQNISDLRIYCTALDADAIKQLYQLGAKIDNKGNLHAFELNEISSNVFRSELIMPYAKSSSGSHGQIVERNGYPAIAIQPTPFYQNLANNESGFLCNEFIPNTQYIIDLWIDSELVMNGSNPSTGGLYLDYTDGTSVGNTFIVTGGIAGWQHKYYITDANKSIKKVSIRYGVNKTVYFRADSFMAPIGTHKITKTGRVITPSLSENSDIYKIQKGGNDLTNQIIEL